MSDYAFVLSRIGSKGSPERIRADEVFKYIVTPAAKDFDLKVRRSDKDSTPGPITSQIVQAIVQARIVIADLTGRNVNVYYELGVAHAFALPVILLVDTVQSIAFDTQNERMIVIGDSEALGATAAEGAAEELRETLSIVLKDGYTPSNIVTEAAAARSLDDLAPDNPIASELTAIREKVEMTSDSVHKLANQVGRQRGQANTSDVISMRDFLENLVEVNRLASDEIDDLITNATSTGFDKWVERLRGRAEELEEARQAAHVPEYDPSEEPF